MTIIGHASLDTGRSHRLEGKCLKCTIADQLQAGRTEAILEPTRNPVHLLFSNADFSAPTLVSPTFE